MNLKLQSSKKSPYAGIIRIRFRVRESNTPISADCCQHPCFYAVVVLIGRVYYSTFPTACQGAEVQMFCTF